MMEARTNTPDRGETEHATIQHGAIAILRIGAGVLAVLGLEAQLAWGVSMAHAADDARRQTQDARRKTQDGVIGRVHPAQPGITRHNPA
jgi:hypothetical protein